MLDMRVNVTGIPLAKLGLEHAVILWPTGMITPLQGFHWLPDATIIQSLLANHPACFIYADMQSFDYDIPIISH